MRNLKFEEPWLRSTNSEELSLSSQALLDLMQAVLDKGYPFRFRARGWSMAPFIQDGDVITVTPLRKDLPKVGNVFAYFHPKAKKLVVHRAIKWHDTGLLFQGDSVSDCADGIIPITNLLGQVKKIERDGRRIWIGLGLERYLIAWLSRTGLITPIFQKFRAWRNRFTRKNNGL